MGRVTGNHNAKVCAAGISPPPYNTNSIDVVYPFTY